jgi:hypothetical protein
MFTGPHGSGLGCRGQLNVKQTECQTLRIAEAERFAPTVTHYQHERYQRNTAFQFDFRAYKNGTFNDADQQRNVVFVA